MSHTVYDSYRQSQRISSPFESSPLHLRKSLQPQFVSVLGRSSTSHAPIIRACEEYLAGRINLSIVILRRRAQFVELCGQILTEFGKFLSKYLIILIVHSVYLQREYFGAIVFAAIQLTFCGQQFMLCLSQNTIVAAPQE